MSVNIFYVYLLLDPRNFFVPFYIGKGKLDRCYTHFKENIQNTRNVFKYRKIQAIKQVTGSFPPVIFWKKELNEIEAYKLETELILRFGRKGIEANGILTNRIIDSIPPSALGIKRKWKPLSEEHKKNIGKAHLGMKRPESCGKNISKALKGRKFSEEICNKLSMIRKGKPSSFSGKHHSEETKDKMRKVKRPAIWTLLNEEKTKIAKKRISEKHSNVFEVLDLEKNIKYLTNSLKQFAIENNIANYKSLWQSSIREYPYLNRWKCKKIYNAKEKYDNDLSFFIKTHTITFDYAT